MPTYDFAGSNKGEMHAHPGSRLANHTGEVVDLYAIRFDPVFRVPDFASYVHDSMPLDILEQIL